MQITDLPTELVDIIVDYAIQNAAKKIQWYFREQYKLEKELFVSLCNSQVSFENINVCFLLYKRIHMSDYLVNDYIKFCLTFKIEIFQTLNYPSNCYFAQLTTLEHKYSQLFE